MEFLEREKENLEKQITQRRKKKHLNKSRSLSKSKRKRIKAGTKKGTKKQVHNIYEYSPYRENSSPEVHLSTEKNKSPRKSFEIIQKEMKIRKSQRKQQKEEME